MVISRRQFVASSLGMIGGTTLTGPLLPLLAAVEDEVMAQQWIVPLYDASAVYGYSDRVQEHPMSLYGAHFLDLQ